jgi:hypothetical protein
VRLSLSWAGRTVRSCTRIGIVGSLAVGPSAPVAAAATGWSVIPSPNVGPAAADDYLSGLSCISATWCMASGYYANAPPGYTAFFEHGDGPNWSVAQSPRSGTPSSDVLINGISCTSALSCMSVGTSRDGGLAEQWDGTRWSVAPVPIGDDVLYGVSCVSAETCVAVGYRSAKGENARSLIELWDGAKWSVMASPNPGPASEYASASGPAHAFLQSVSCPSLGSCVAVGSYTTPAGRGDTLAEQWDGTTWSIMPSPDKPSVSNGLDAVSCATPQFCMAVGNFQAVGYDTLAESWDGGYWSIVASPDGGPTGFDDELFGVSCPSATSCTAVGNDGVNPAAASGKTLVESWDGSAWSVVTSSNEGFSGLSAVSCLPLGPCTAVGAHSSGRNGGTLVEASLQP